MDTVPLVRHLAICLGSLAVWLWPGSLEAGNNLLWILAVAVLCNLALAVLTDLPPVSAGLRLLSPALGLASWAILAAQTGGARSPFVAGFSLEILLSALAFPVRGTQLITLASILTLWGQQVWLGLDGMVRLLVLQTGFMAVTGGMALLLAVRWEKARNESSQRQGELQGRLEQLERELATVRFLEGTGESAARLAHSVKNTVHAMRGFTSLIEQTPGVSQEGNAALDGLQGSIRRLEEVVRESLGRIRSPRGPDRSLDGAQLQAAIQEVVREVSVSFPDIRWSIHMQQPLPLVKLPGAVVHEVFLSLARNAAEAMKGTGEVWVKGHLDKERLEIAIEDQGTGIGESELSQVFKPGYSTKREGSGLGLFLARRVMESYGGSLRVVPRSEGGALFSMEIPLERA